jgi:hypothetical protein
MSNKRFVIEKEIEWSLEGNKTWYHVKLLNENNKANIISITNDEEQANQTFESAVNSYFNASKTIIREHEVEENK